MKILNILGSPRKNGNTAKVLDLYEENLRNKGHSVERIRITDYQINGCLECWACTKSNDKPGCVQKDDVQSIFEKMFSSDAIVYASPLIGWDISSQIKSLFDRHFSIVKGYGTPNHKSFIENKVISLLITCMGPQENNTDLVEEFFNRFSNYINTKQAKKYIVTGSMSPDFPERAKKTAEKMVEDIEHFKTELY